MNTDCCLRNQARPPGSSIRLPQRLLVLFALLLPFAPVTAAGAGNERLFGPPPAHQLQDDVWLISTRKIGTKCNPAAMERDLDCRLLVAKADDNKAWAGADWRELTHPALVKPTLIYVHGNRVSPGRDRVEGMHIYRSFVKHRAGSKPVRFIIWSWPSEQIPGPIKDYLVKAQRTNPVAWQLAWLLNKLPEETPISMVGYSYGTRVVCGASHLLGGGTIGQLKLKRIDHPSRPPARAALMAAAFDADWLQPRQFYSRSLSQLEKVILATNQRDPAMRFYHLSNGRGRMEALGKFGLYRPQSLGQALSRVRKIDYTQAVGRSHVVEDYLAAQPQMRSMWRELMPAPADQVASVTTEATQHVLANSR